MKLDSSTNLFGRIDFDASTVLKGSLSSGNETSATYMDLARSATEFDEAKYSCTIYLDASACSKISTRHRNDGIDVTGRHSEPSSRSGDAALDCSGISAICSRVLCLGVCVDPPRLLRSLALASRVPLPPLDR